MSVHLAREIDHLRNRLLAVGAEVQRAVAQAVRALVTRDAQLARSVIDGDEAIDRHEVAVEEECLKVLALHQPVAQDLRLVVAILKINNDLERMGDLATNIAKRAVALAEHEPADVAGELEDMALRVQAMLRDALASLVAADAELARRVCRADDAIDDARHHIEQQALAEIRSNGARADYWTKIHSVARHLERLADMCTNIAEDVIYLVTGEIVRHRAEP